MCEIDLQEFIIRWERKVKTKCELCHSSFKFSKVEHICKRCYRSVCDECSPHKVKCYMPDFNNGNHRMCRNCHEESQMLNEYVRNNHLKWGEDSDLVRLWMKKLGLKNIPNKRSTDRGVQKYNVNFMKIWKSLNFSLREFLGLVIDEAKISQEEFCETINLALSEISNSKIANIQHSIYILLFFLAHCSIHYAVYFTTVILQVTYAEDVSMDNIHYFLEQRNCVEIEVYKMETMIEESFEKMVKRCTVNVFTTEVSINIINNLISFREVEELEKGIAYVFSQRKEFICQNSNKPLDVYLDILRNISCHNFRKVTKEMGRFGLSEQECASGSERSDRGSRKSSVSSIKFTSLKKENDELKLLISNQEIEIEELKRLNSKLQKDSLKRSPELQKKSVSANFLPSENEDNLFRETIDESGTVNRKSGLSSTDYEEHNEIIHKKNEDILNLRKEIEMFKEKLRESDMESNKNESEDDTRKESKMALKESEEIKRLKEENESLNKVNKRMYMKLHQLSNLLMDKEEKNLKEANSTFQQITDGLSNDEIKKGCQIF